METFIVFVVSFCIFASIMRDKILDIAEEMFLKLGFKTVTMDDICNTLGISKKTLYKYFSNKSELVDIASKKLMESFDNKIKEIKTQNYNAIEEEFIIKTVFKERLDNVKTSPMYQLRKYYPETHKELIKNQARIFKECNYSNLEKGIQEGLYRDNMDKDLVMNFYYTLLLGIYESNLHDMDDIIKNEYEILEYHIRAIATEKGLIEFKKQINNKNKNN